MIRLAHLFYQLNVGGTEKMIRVLCEGLPCERFEHHVVISHFLGRTAQMLPSYVRLHLLPPAGKTKALLQILQHVDVSLIYSVNLNPFFVWASSLANVQAMINSVNASIHFPYSAYVDFTICASNYVRYLQSPIKNIQTIYNGVNPTRPNRNKEGLPEQSIILLELCRANKEKVLCLEEVVAHLRGQGIPVYGWIVGREGRSTDYLRYFGQVTDPSPFLADAHFLIHLPAHEAFSNALLEAMAYGVVPIATAAGGNSEVIVHEENGFLIDVQSSVNTERIHQEIFKFIRGILDRPQRFLQLSRRAQQTVKDKFTLEQMTSGFERVILQALARTSFTAPRLAPLIEETTAGDFSIFLDLLESYCFTKHANIERVLGENIARLTGRKRAFVLAILGYELLKQSRIPLAREMLSEACKIWQEDFYIHLYCGMAYQQLQDLEKAAQHYSRSIEINPYELEAWLNLIQCYIRLNRIDRAQEMAAKTISELDQQHPILHTLQSVLFL